MTMSRYVQLTTAPARPLPKSFDEVGLYWLALATSALIGTRISVYAGISVGVVVALLLAPLWFGQFLRSRMRTALLALGVVTLGWGYALEQVSSASHSVTTRQGIADTAVLLQLLVGVGVLLWASEVAGVARTGLAFGGGIVVQGILGAEYATSNPWKTFFAVPAAIIVLSLVASQRRNGPDLLALLLLAAASGAFDSRSYAATFAIGALLKLWQMRPRALSRQRSVTLTLGLFVILGAFVYWLGQALLVGGYLGSDAQQRTIEQIRTSGSVLLGGRPELSATVAMMRDDITGHGIGVSPSFHDVMVAKSAMSAIGYDPNNGYVDRFMFGNGIELHSVLGDLWARWGLAGIVLFTFIAVLIIVRLTSSVLDRTATGIVLFLSCWSLWNLLFSPLYSAVPTLTMCLAFLLGVSPRSATDDDPDAGKTASDGRPQRPRRLHQLPSSTA